MTDAGDLPLTVYVEMSDEVLLETLGEALLGTGPGFGPADIERGARFAQSWLERRAAEFRERLCGDVWISLEREGGFDRLADAAVVADGLQALLGKPTAYIVAVILVRRGLGGLCGQGE